MTIPEEALHPHLRSPLWRTRPDNWVCRCDEEPGEWEMHEEKCIPTVPWFKDTFELPFVETLANMVAKPPYYVPKEYFTVEVFVEEMPRNLDHVCKTHAINYDIICMQSAGHELPHLGLTGQLADVLVRKLGLVMWYNVYYLGDNSVKQMLEKFPGSRLL